MQTEKINWGGVERSEAGKIIRSFTWKWPFCEDRWHRREAKHIYYSLSRIHSDSNPTVANVRFHRRLMSGLVTATTCTSNLEGKKSSSGDQTVIKEILNYGFLFVSSWVSQAASDTLPAWQGHAKMDHRVMAWEAAGLTTAWNKCFL